MVKLRLSRFLLFSICLMCVAVEAQTQSQRRPGSSPTATSPDPNMPRPIDARDSVFIEELTWLEVRDAIRAGKTTVIIATGGVEMNGPYLATGKHNYILRATSEAIARKLGNALVTPAPSPSRKTPSSGCLMAQSQGVHEVDEGHHDDYGITAEMMVVDPKTVRMTERMAKGKFSINGVQLAPTKKTIEMGKKAVAFRASVTVEAIKKAIGH